MEKITINFYLKDDSKITSFYELSSNPFKVNNIVYLSVNNIYPVECDKIPEKIRDKVLTNNKEVRELFNNTKVKLIEEFKYISFDEVNPSKLTIDYYCILVD